MVTRREIVKRMGILGGGCILFPLFSSGCVPRFSQKKSQVAIARGLNIADITRTALDLIGGMPSIVKRGHTVFIKPNYISGGLDGHDPVTAGEIAHPEVVATVAEECVKAGASKVMISEWVERPPKIQFGGKKGVEGAQVLNRVEMLNRKYGNRIHLFNLMDHTSSFSYYPSDTLLRYIAIPDIVARADVKITIPSLKTHHQESPVTLGMKNWMGIMPSVLYGEPRYKLHEAGIHQVIVDINKALRPHLTVVDGSYGMEGEGTTLVFNGQTVDVSSRIGGFLVVAGRDPVATDTIATRVISKDWAPVENDDLGTPYYVHHLRMAYAQRLGEIRRSRIEVKGELLEQVAMNWRMPKDDTYPERPLI
jgi:uncharacterized protein (DUF362 family)